MVIIVKTLHSSALNVCYVWPSDTNSKLLCIYFTFQEKADVTYIYTTNRRSWKCKSLFSLFNRVNHMSIGGDQGNCTTKYFNNKQATVITLMLHVWGNVLSVLEKKKWLHQWQIVVALVKKNFVVVIWSILRFNSQTIYLNKDNLTF